MMFMRLFLQSHAVCESNNILVLIVSNLIFLSPQSPRFLFHCSEQEASDLRRHCAVRLTRKAAEPPSASRDTPHHSIANVCVPISTRSHRLLSSSPRIFLIARHVSRHPCSRPPPRRSSSISSCLTPASSSWSRFLMFFCGHMQNLPICMR